MAFQYSDRFYQIDDLDLFPKFIEPSFKHPIRSRLLANAAATSRSKTLYVQNKRTENAPMDVLVLTHTHFFVDFRADFRGALADKHSLKHTR